MKRLLFRVLPTYYSFLGGIFVSIAANLFTGIYGSDSPPAKINILLLSAGLALLSSLLWIVVAIIADDARGTRASLTSTGLAVAEADTTVVAIFGSRALLALIVALFLATTSLIVLIQQPKDAPKVESQTQTEFKANPQVAGSQASGIAAKIPLAAFVPLAARSASASASAASK